MGPVWEANHVWLIFVLTVVWTAYPVGVRLDRVDAAVPLFIAALGIVLRGAAYALRAGARRRREQRRGRRVFALSSILTPFALGAAVGGIASGRVPVGNAARRPRHELAEPDLDPRSACSPWRPPPTWPPSTWRRRGAAGETELAERFRSRALGAGVVAGARRASPGSSSLHYDADRALPRARRTGRGLPALVVSVVAGVRDAGARLAAALRAGPLHARRSRSRRSIAGWALAQDAGLPAAA